MESGGRGQRRRFSAEYQAEAVRLVGNRGKRSGAIARAAGAVTARQSGSAHGARNPKKSDRLLRQGERVRFAFIETEKACFPVALMCRGLGGIAGQLLCLAPAAGGGAHPSGPGAGGGGSARSMRSTTAVTAVRGCGWNRAIAASAAGASGSPG